MEPITILYSDADIVVAVKPVGVLSEDHETQANMPALLRTQFASIGEQTEILTVHRLDKVVGGVMVFAKNQFAAGKLIADVQNHKVNKEYLAILRGHPSQPEDTLEDLLFRDSRVNKSYVVTRMRKGVRDAKLSYRTIGSTPDYSLVRIKLYTGRTHQIRVQFSSRGLPLLGDIRYGSKADCSTSLWSFHLGFQHPKTKKMVDVSYLPPTIYPWNLFPLASIDLAQPFSASSMALDN